MNQGIVFAIITATSFGFWTFFHKLAGEYVNPLFGAIFISGIGTIAGLFFLIPQINNMQFYTNWKGIVFLIITGLLVLIIDFGAVKTYSSGISISVAGPIIFGGSIAVASILGLFIGEIFSLAKFLGIICIIIGTVILSQYS